jgi:branched-chain amino acid transport system ATP-binding protein
MTGDQMAGSGMTNLAVHELSVSYGGVRALDGVSFEVAPGSVQGIIGPNGSGKTTLVNAVMGAVRPRAGTIEFDGVRLDRMSVHRRRRSGLSRTFQNLSLSEALTVEENLQVGAHVLGLRRAALTEEIGRVAEIFGITSVLRRDVVVLPYGVRKYVELARAFLGRPRLVILDEAAAGLNSQAKTELAGLLRETARSDPDLSLVVIEHDMDFLGKLVDVAIVLADGHLLASGTLAEVISTDEVRDAYLGVGRAAVQPDAESRGSDVPEVSAG